MASLLLLLRLFSEAASAASASRSSIHDFVGDGAGAIPLGNYVEATASALGNTIFLRIEKSRKKGRLLLRFEHKWPRGSSKLRLLLRTRFKSDAKLVVSDFTIERGNFNVRGPRLKVNMKCEKYFRKYVELVIKTSVDSPSFWK